MSRARWLLYLWPGLPQLYWRGAWSALAAAAGFALLLDLALVATWVWNELLPGGLRPVVWPAWGLVWIGGIAATGWRGLSAAAAADLNEREDLFPRSLGEYLRGNWLEAEILCRRLLERDARDAEALLLLATVLRHAGRTDEGRATLLQLRRLDAADKWEQEINDELARLDGQQGSQNSVDAAHDENEQPTQPPNEIQETDVSATGSTKLRLMDAA